DKLKETYGEELSNDLLGITSQILFQNIRSSDIIARWGENEFVLVCPHTELLFAKQLAEKLRNLIEEAVWPDDVPVTASFGVAEREADELPTEFIGKATKALRAAKAQGRNKVVTATAHMVEITTEN